MSAAEEIKACCASAYGSDLARWLLGDSFHPGGAALTSRLARALAVGPGATAVDVGSGPGTSAVLLARETGCRVIGVDVSGAGVAAAARAAEAAGVHEQVTFVCADAEALPLAEASVDGVLSECTFCLLPNKAVAAAEVARVLRPGARLALSDVTARPEGLPPELRTLPAWVACLADARPLEEIGALFDRAGFDVEALERRDDALLPLLERVEARLHLVRLLNGRLPSAAREAAETALALSAIARRAVADGALGYGVMIARRR